MYQDAKGIVGRGNIDKRLAQWQYQWQWNAQWQWNHSLGALKTKTTLKDIIYQAGMSELVS